MRIRTLAPFALVLAVACGPATEETATADETAVAEDTQDYAAEATAAVEGLVEYWETHYDMGHAPMVASTLTDDAIFWGGDGSMLFGRPAIEAQLASEIEMLSPQLDLAVDETIVAGDFGVMRGTYEFSGTAEGESFTNTGYWVSLAENVEGEWKTRGVIGNVDSADQTLMPPEGGMASLPADAGQGEEIVRERLDYYITHFNAGHPDMVAAVYTEDAVVMGSGEAARMGRAAIEARLAEMVESGTQIESIDVYRARELDDTYVTAAGTYTTSGPDGEVTGHYGAVYMRVDGQLLLHRLLTSNHPVAM